MGVSFVTVGAPLGTPWLRAYQVILYLHPNLKDDKAGARLKRVHKLQQGKRPSARIPKFDFQKRKQQSPGITDRAALEWILRRTEDKGMHACDEHVYCVLQRQ